jgi:hypothetical protein
MVRRIIHQLDFQSGGIRKHHHAVHESSPMTRILRPIVQVDHRSARVGIPGLVRLPPLFQAVRDEITRPVRGPDEDAQQARAHVQDPLRPQVLRGLGVVIQGLDRVGTARFPVSGIVPHRHFGLGVHRDPDHGRVVVGRLILRTDVVEDRLRFRDLLHRFGLLHPSPLEPQTIEDLADRVPVRKFLIGPAFLVAPGLPHRVGRHSRVPKGRRKPRVRLAFRSRPGADVGLQRGDLRLRLAISPRREIVQAGDPGSQFVPSQFHGLVRPAKDPLRLPEIAIQVIEGHLSLKRPPFRPGQLSRRVLERRNDFLREYFHHDLPGRGSPIPDHREAIRIC